jgi:hypothetical protein
VHEHVPGVAQLPSGSRGASVESSRCPWIACAAAQLIFPGTTDTQW